MRISDWSSDVCSSDLDAMLAMRDDIVPELAWQMGRPVRYGAGELRGFEERARHMIAIAPQALAPIAPEARTGFRERKSVVEGKSVSVRVDLGGRRNIKTKLKIEDIDTNKTYRH